MGKVGLIQVVKRSPLGDWDICCLLYTSDAADE